MGRKASPSRVEHGINKRLGVQIRVLREGAGLTQRELASKAGLSPSHLAMLEKGQRNPSLGTVEQIASALDIGVLSLLSEESAESQAETTSPRVLVRLISRLRQMSEARLLAVEDLLNAFDRVVDDADR